eukprot:TRINITY_DN51528_c0_g2_i1.p1 TRINITY_DN51528_c0_g2~~TRINITY_DN51528_c0_g2_i1.p1  ORF type:complete len:620 (-),score=179.47 TRINITY_DN51528_c0_g2_i1:407-2266(-)
MPAGKGGCKGPPMPPGKGGAKGPPPPGGKGPGKGPPAPGKGAGKPGKGGPKGKPAGAPVPKANLAKHGHAPLGRRLHMGGNIYEDVGDGTVFGQFSGRFAFNADMLEAMFKRDEPAQKATRRRSVAAKPTGIAVYDSNRAQNISIVTSRLKIPSEQICDLLARCDASSRAIGIDDIEGLDIATPTPEEVEKLAQYKDSPQVLRDIEQKMLPFCFLPRMKVKVRNMKLAMTHEHTYGMLHTRFTTLCLGLQEVQTSLPLRQLLEGVLRVVNYINHGVSEPEQIHVKAFAIDSLKGLSNFKNGNVHAIHFLCVTLMSQDPGFKSELVQSLGHVEQASKEKVSDLKSQLEAHKNEVRSMKSELDNFPDGPSARILSGLVPILEAEVQELQFLLDQAEQEALKARSFLDPAWKPDASKQDPPEGILATLTEFAMKNFGRTWAQIEERPSLWAPFAMAGQTPPESENEGKKKAPAVPQRPRKGSGAGLSEQSGNSGEPEGSHEKKVVEEQPVERVPRLSTELVDKRKSSVSSNIVQATPKRKVSNLEHFLGIAPGDRPARQHSNASPQPVGSGPSSPEGPATPEEPEEEPSKDQAVVVQFSMNDGDEDGEENLASDLENAYDNL